MTGFHRETILKSDIFSTIERGTFNGQPAIRRDASTARWWVWPLARHFLKRERRGLECVRSRGIAPELLHIENNALVRSWLEGLPMQMAKPNGQRHVFISAKRSLQLCHRAGVVHNDLAKEPNWLITPDGQALLTDFQLASVHSRRGRLFRILAYEDLRHLLKHKRKYCPNALTRREKAILARKSLFARFWMQTGKRVYRWITRGILGVRDREGGGLRLARQGPVIETLLQADPRVTGAAVVAFPYPRRGVGLYAFVESSALSPSEAMALLDKDHHPDRLQIVSRLPRDEDGEMRCDLLSLIATNQLDLIAPASQNDPALLATLEMVIAGRLNFADRT